MEALASQHTVLKSLLCGAAAAAAGWPGRTLEASVHGEAPPRQRGPRRPRHQRRPCRPVRQEAQPVQLEKVCSRLKTQMSKMKAARRAAAGGGGGIAGGLPAASMSLPRMCLKLVSTDCFYFSHS
uniref:Uncharacterized protein n=1 Tax=Oryza meridionalis TaxID=40149 RepID=A0A0E0DPI7_9ORYZ